MNNLNNKITSKNIVITLLIAIFFITDRYLKILASNLDQHTSINLWTNFLSFSYAKNYYIAFSLPLNGPFLNIIIAILIGLLIIIIAKLIYSKKPNTLETFSFTIILLGAISNFIDRQNYGYVIDYLYIKNFTVFNLADIMISLGALVLIINNLRKK